MGGKTVSPILVLKRDNGEYSEEVAKEFTLNKQYSDWNDLVDGSNHEQLCGFTDWRVAELNELKSLLYNASCGSNDEYCKRHYNEPTIAQSYFPYTQRYYWTGTPGGAKAERRGWFSTTYTFYSWQVRFFGGGHSLISKRDGEAYVRLARGGKFFEKREQDRLAQVEKERQEKKTLEEKKEKRKLH
ncbi:MAG: DUF1566 domain-containing protein [Oceanospirillaceae bacterium]|nr:DUF1566 domain-containing protein [Oceanospirillaceae bacterium]